jgi:Asp-tRNA(Asn)/Glu-tRNA(Gln) amidotransferase A subunit family amidase
MTTSTDDTPRRPDRRTLFKALAALGVGGAVFQRAAAAQAEKAVTVTADMVKQAEWIAGLELTDDERKAVAAQLNGALREARSLRAQPITNDVPPALTFFPAPWQPASAPGPRGAVEPTVKDAPKKPDNGDDLAFLPVSALAALIRTKQVSSVELTKLYLERLKKYDPALRCVVTLTEDLALKQAAEADKEIAAGRYRGPLHGVPWGAKDLIAFPGYRTTWGGGPYKEQKFDTKATVARRLEEAGAVLVAKLSLGALAWGDVWFDGGERKMTRNPWAPKSGSSGSSAGSACAAVAGLVGFAVGSETLGSIVSPCTVCGASGLRPTFGRVSRAGCMTLAWSMDKLGPIARSVEDCALVFGAIHGADGLDAAAVDRPFGWPTKKDLKELRVGYFNEGQPELKALRELGVKLVPLKLPDGPVPSQTILHAETAAAFDDLTRKGPAEGLGLWPSYHRAYQFVTAIEYLRAQRVRWRLMHKMEEALKDVDLYVGGNDLALTNLTGHPTVVLPGGFRKRDDGEVPTATKFTGRLYGEAELLAVANAFQQATGHHLKHPPMDKVTVENAG